MPTDSHSSKGNTEVDIRQNMAWQTQALNCVMFVCLKPYWITMYCMHTQGMDDSLLVCFPSFAKCPLIDLFKLTRFHDPRHKHFDVHYCPKTRRMTAHDYVSSQ